MILVTGAGGFVGRHVLARLGARRVFVLKSRTQGGRDLRLAPPAADPTTKIDAIVHLAGDSHVGRSVEMPRQCIENNVGSLLTMLDYARARPGCRFIHLSTDEALDPRNPYGASKAAQEAIVEAYRETYGVPACIVRADLVLGAGQPEDKFVPQVARALLAGEMVSIFADQAGQIGTRCWQSATNVADAIAYLIDHDHQLVHVGGARLSNLEMAGMVAEILRRPLHVEMVKRPDIRAGCPTLNAISLARLGWTPPSTLQDELTAMLVALTPA